jgi:hypothetical protein
MLVLSKPGISPYRLGRGVAMICQYRRLPMRPPRHQLTMVCSRRIVADIRANRIGPAWATVPAAQVDANRTVFKDEKAALPTLAASRRDQLHPTASCAQLGG